MAPKKTTKAAEAKKATEPKTKKTKKTTKAAPKAKATTKTKKTTTKKKVTEEETVSNEETELTPDVETPTEDPVEETEEVNEVNEEVPLEETTEEQPEQEETKTGADEEKINEHRIFITRIAFEATKDDLEEYFKKFGTVYDAYCPKQNNYSGLNKGFGFISFDNEESIKKVFETGPHVIMGREVIVDKATGTKYHSATLPPSHPVPKRAFHPHRRYRDYYPDTHRFKRHHEGYSDHPSKFPRRERHYERDNYNPNLPPYRQNVTSSTFDPNKPVSYVFSGSRSESRNHDYSRTYSNGPKNGRDRSAPKLFVGRIGFETNVQSLRSYFSQFGDVVDVYIPKDSATQKSKGFGFLTFASKSSLHTVLDPNLKHVVDGREIIVDYADVHTRRT